MLEPRDFKSPKYQKWRRQVYQRDQYRCQFPACDGSCKDLEAHHIVRWADCPGLRYVVSNGITLCRAHHDEIKNRESEFEAVFKGIVSLKSGDAAVQLLLMRHARRKEERGG